jgi:hypothetical protein
MNAPAASPFSLDWTSANQQRLVAEFARLKRRLSPAAEHPATIGADRETAAPARTVAGEDAAIDGLSAAFGLSVFERDLLLLCAGAEMDGQLAHACATAHGDATRPWVSFGLALAVLDDPHWSALTLQRPLRRWRLLEVDSNAGLAAGRLAIDERVLHFLVGINELDARLAPLLRPALALPRQAASHARATQAAIAALDSDDRKTDSALPVVVLEGDDPSAQEDVAARCAGALGLACLRLAAADIPASAEERAALLTLWQREAMLQGAALLIAVADPASPAADGARAFVESAGGPGSIADSIPCLILLACPSAPALVAETLRLRIDKPSGDERRQLWSDALGGAALNAGADLDRTASHFRLGSRTLQDIAATIKPQLAVANTADTHASNLLWERCREESRGGLDHLAQRLECHADWDTLVLPEAQLTVLRQIAAHLRQRYTVQETWGFAAQSRRGLGLSTLFCGESGTGKTLAAEVLAHALHLDLYRIDLSAVVSKYIGETEKNLRQVFDAAEDCGAILLFDEADALFGKRSEVKDSHDRHANIEISYLLQRMEAYHGLAVLTTNLKSSLDAAFLRRLRFVVQFPFPDQAQRLALWQRVFPAATPRRDLDLDKLARLSMTGGSIRNIALNAAYLAADAGEPVAMNHLLQAAHAEASKRERPLTDAETRGWA